MMVLMTGSAWSNNVNDETTSVPPTYLFEGANVTLTDLLRAAEFLDRQSSTKAQPGKNLDKAIEQFKTSRDQQLNIGPKSIVPDPKVSPLP
jgi:hypothetical protein